MSYSNILGLHSPPLLHPCCTTTAPDPHTLMGNWSRASVGMGCVATTQVQLKQDGCSAHLVVLALQRACNPSLWRARWRRTSLRRSRPVAGIRTLHIRRGSISVAVVRSVRLSPLEVNTDDSAASKSVYSFGGGKCQPVSSKQRGCLPASQPHTES